MPGIQTFLETLIERSDPSFASVHRHEHLHLASAEAITSREPLRHEVHHQLRRCYWVFGRQEEAISAVATKVRQLTSQNTLRIHGDARAGPLAEKSGQAGNGEAFGPQQAGEDIAGPDAGELIRVANQQEVGPRCQRFDKLVGEQHIEHTSLVDDDQISVERVFWAPASLTTGAQLQEAV
jgi:hypothetical protein